MLQINYTFNLIDCLLPVAANAPKNVPNRKTITQSLIIVTETKTVVFKLYIYIYIYTHLGYSVVG